MDRLMADLPQTEADALRGVVDALRHASVDETATHIKLTEPPSRRST
jgi:hypothetical protein